MNFNKVLSAFVFACVVGFVASPAIATAHATGASYNQTIGAYTADIGYDPVTFTAGESTRFDFKLWKGATTSGEEAPFAQIWIRIVRDKNSVLATGLWDQPIGPTTLLYEFETPGNYVLEASYRDASGNDIAVASFPISVMAANQNSLLANIAICASLIALGAFAGILVMKYFYRD